FGREVRRDAVRVLGSVAEMAGHEFGFEEAPIGGTAVDQFDTRLPAETLEKCLSSNAVFLGAVGGPRWDNLPRAQKPETGLLQLRQALGGFANIRPAACHPALAECSPLRKDIVEGADVVVVRELLGGLYFGEPRGFRPEFTDAFNTMRYSEHEVERIARVAFETARTRRRKVSSVDKANVLEASQLWREVVNRVSRNYPEVALQHMYVDACAMHLVMNPRQF